MCIVCCLLRGLAAVEEPTPDSVLAACFGESHSQHWGNSTCPVQTVPCQPTPLKIPFNPFREMPQGACWLASRKASLDQSLENMAQQYNYGSIACDKPLRVRFHSLPPCLMTRCLCVVCLQVVLEAPPGLNKNIQRTYASWSSQFLLGHVTSTTARRSTNSDDNTTRALACPARAVPASLVPLRAQMLFVLAWFNAAVQERQNYVPVVGLSVSGGETCVL